MKRQIERAISEVTEVDFWSVSTAASVQDDLLSFAMAFGVTRVGWTTLLDRIGVPTCYCIRPDATHPLCTYSSGKGFDIKTALISGVFEAYERWASEISLVQFEASSDFLARYYSGSIMTIDNVDIPSDHVRSWSLGRHLSRGKPVFACSELVEFPPRKGNSTLTTTTGLAAGLSYFDATVRGILECIERHTIANMQPDHLLRVQLDRTSTRTQALVEKMRLEEIDVQLFLVASNGFIPPTAYCYAYDRWLEVPQLQCSGFGTGLSPTEATERALLEVCQSRAAMLSGLRDDVSIRVKPKTFGFDDIIEQRSWYDTLKRISRNQDDWSPLPGQLTNPQSFLMEICRSRDWVAFPLRNHRGVPAVRVLGIGLDDRW